MICCAVSLILLVLIGYVVFKIYVKLTTAWCRSHTCLVGKTTIITGANTGIGYETALDFAKRGARVILACRDAKRAEEARKRIVEETGNENVVVQLVDFASFDSVRAFAKKIEETENRLDILVNNAGAAGIGDKKSKDGHVFVMQINYFSPFLLTNLLLRLLKKTKNSRIVNVSSMAAKFAFGFDIHDIDKFPGDYYVYYNSKLCNNLFTSELGQKLQGTDVTTYSLHPGSINTEIFRHAEGLPRIIFNLLRKNFFKTCEEGAQTTIYCSVAKGIENYSGDHFDGCQRVEPYKTTQVPGLSKKLWEVTENIVGLKAEEMRL